MADAVRIFEVGPRDGLQNEPRAVSTALKIKLVRGLIASGVRDFELGAFVRADRVPQMADTDRLYAEIRKGRLKLGSAHAWALVPNRRGLERAVAAGAKRVAVFTAASESFTRRNIGMSIAESLTEFAAVTRDARSEGIEVRGYVSTVFGCPFEGAIPPKRALAVIDKLARLGVTQVSIGDTIGVATPKGVDAVVKPALRALGRKRVAVHFHDTRGAALANALRAFELGVRTIDASAGGLGGCPFAPGATGNLATEDLIYMLHGMGIRTGIRLDALCKAVLEFSRRIRRPISSRYLAAFSATS